MSGPTFLEAKRELCAMLGSLLDRPVEEEFFDRGAERGAGIDAILGAGKLKFLVVYKQRALAEDIKRQLDQISELRTPAKKEVLTVVVPFMTKIGRTLLKKAGVSWFDLSGNAEITAPNLRIMVDGKPNRFPEPRRSPDLFSPKSARISRWLLVHYPQWFNQSELTASVGVSKALTSRICGRLEKAAFIERSTEGKVRAASPDDLLDSWRDGYDFSSHRILKAHLPARDGPGLLSSLAEKLSSTGIRYAFTGLSAAWLLAPFANFRMATVYVEGVLLDQLLSELGGRIPEGGSNFWLVSPNDPGVFDGQFETNGIPTVHPIQVYLDLKGHPERAEEAAAELRRIAFPWKVPNAE